MKKILTLSLLLAGFSLPAYMQDRVPVEPYQPSEYFFETLSRARSMGRDIYVDDTNIPAPQAAPAAANADEQQIGYVNPAGTLFLGMDEAGKGTFFKSPGVIGGWSDSIPCWKWLNKQVGYKSIKYLTAFSYAYPSSCQRRLHVLHGCRRRRGLLLAARYAAPDRALSGCRG